MKLLELTFIIFYYNLYFCFGEIDDPVVEILNGKIRGKLHENYYSFESIRYAEPPIGANRFEPPIPYTEKWSDIRDATEPPPVCIQWDQFISTDNKLAGVEDCLTVNIYSPNITKGHALFPVLVFIHGGAFMFGSAIFNGHDIIMKHQNMVVVKINYRLGPLGFLSTEDNELPGNLGLKDQFLALKWIKENIERFNGNSNNITMLGFSAGAVSVHLQMLNKQVEGIVNSGIAFSGTAFQPWSIVKNPSKRAFKLGNLLNCPIESSKELKECLKLKPAENIVNAVQHFLLFLYNPFAVFGPVVEPQSDDAFLSDTPENIVIRNQVANIPLIVSYTKNDGGYNAGMMMQKQNNGMELIDIFNEKWNELAPIILFYENTVDSTNLNSYSENLRQRYFNDNKFSVETYPQLEALFTDVLFADGVKQTLKLHGEYTTSPVYSYVYNNPAPFGITNVLANRTDCDFGTGHGDDVFLIFDSLIRVNVPFRKDELAISENFVKMIESFSLTGVPTYGERIKLPKASKGNIQALEIKKDTEQIISLL